MVTVIEVEDQIAELHKDGKTSKAISKIVHKNFTFIGAVLRKRFPEEYAEAENSTVTKETQALKLFSLRKTPTQAAIELNESPESIEKFFILSFSWKLIFTLFPCLIGSKVKSSFEI